MAMSKSNDHDPVDENTGVYGVGASVEACFGAVSGEGDGANKRWFDGKVQSLNVDGTYNIRFKGGLRQDSVAKHYVRPARKGYAHSHRPHTVATSSSVTPVKRGAFGSPSGPIATHTPGSPDNDDDDDDDDDEEEPLSLIHI